MTLKMSYIRVSFIIKQLKELWRPFYLSTSLFHPSQKYFAESKEVTDVEKLMKKMQLN